MISPDPVILEYGHRQEKTRALPAYLGFALGLSIASVVQWIGTALVAFRGIPTVARFNVIWLVRNSIITVMPALVICGITLLLRRLLARNPRFARLPTGVIAGVVCGAFPLFLLERFHMDPGFTVVVISIVVWNFGTALGAGILLCRGRRVEPTTGVTR